jgi:hypothetical protein
VGTGQRRRTWTSNTLLSSERRLESAVRMSVWLVAREAPCWGRSSDGLTAREPRGKASSTQPLTSALSSALQAAASANSSTASLASQPLRPRCAAAATPAAAARAAAALCRPSSGSISTKPSEPSPRGVRTTACRVLHGLPPLLLKAWRWNCRPAAKGAAAAAAAKTRPSNSAGVAPASSCWFAAKQASNAPLCLRAEDSNTSAQTSHAAGA